MVTHPSTNPAVHDGELYSQPVHQTWSGVIKLFFCLVDINVEDFFSFSNLVVTRGHQYKLYKKRTVSHVRATFFSERVINVWNSLPKDVDFSSLSRFKRSILRVDFSSFIKCF